MEHAAVPTIEIKKKKQSSVEEGEESGQKCERGNK